MGSRRRVLAGAVVVAAAVTGVAAFGRRRRSERAYVPAGSAERIGTVAVAVGRGTATAVARHGRAALLGVERDETLAQRWQAATAEEITAALGEMRGAMMKLGQMASYLDQGLPEPIRSRLASLQDAAPVMAPHVAAEIVETELGAAPESLFDEWDPVPFAAASIGQVHRAVTRDGEAVAVKVQYPGIAESIGGDLASAALVFRTFGSLFPGLDSATVIDEVRTRVVEECDYALEAQRQERFARFFAGHPRIRIPAVRLDLSGRRVLTTELVAGTSMAGTQAWLQAERDLAGETIYRFVFASIYGLGAFNGDPHPGNYLFHGGGEVTFLDFGLVKDLSDAEVESFAAMTKAMVWDRDPGAFRAAVEAAGYLPTGLDVSDQEVTDYFGHFYEFIRHDAAFTMTPEFASAVLRRMVDADGPHAPILRAATIPRSGVIIQRINLGLHAVLGELGATANWRRIAEEVWPWTGGLDSGSPDPTPDG